ncbi:MAG TPA: ACT domain-containing protein [Vicinamibacteria bacterium]|nr:ACT domain-containing protein [Vicinamibacteria bacterium]
MSPETGGVLAARLGSDLSVELQQNRPGMLARAAEAIASGGLNLEGFAEVDGTLHLLTGDPRSARHALEAAGLRVSGERDVLVVRIEDRSGAAAQVFGRLAGAGVNVHHTYVASGHRIVIAADDPAQALEALRA